VDKEPMLSSMRARFVGPMRKPPCCNDPIPRGPAAAHSLQPAPRSVCASLPGPGPSAEALCHSRFTAHPFSYVDLGPLRARPCPQAPRRRTRCCTVCHVLQAMTADRRTSSCPDGCAVPGIELCSGTWPDK
jgi:hypothetical protein